MKHFFRHSRTERGGTLALVAVFLVALFAFAALSIDVGQVLVQRNRIQEAGDAAAMAAVADWALANPAATVIQVARNFAAANGTTTNDVLSVRVGRWVDATKTFEAKSSLTSGDFPAVEVQMQKSVSMGFARVVGMDAMSPKTLSVAIAGASRGTAGALPWAVCGDFVPNKCDPVILQFFQGASSSNTCSTGSGGNSGNFGQLDLSGGGNDYKTLIQNGYNGVLRVGDCVSTDTGASTGQTRQGLDDRLAGLPEYNCTPTSAPPDNKRLAIIPQVDTLDVSGTKKVCIVGFYVVAIEGYAQGGKEVIARFISAFNGSEVDPTRPPEPGRQIAIQLVK